MRISFQYDTATEHLYVFSDGQMITQKNGGTSHRVVGALQELMKEAGITDEPIKHSLMRAWSAAFNRAVPSPPQSTPLPTAPKSTTAPTPPSGFKAAPSGGISDKDNLPDPAADRADQEVIDAVLASKGAQDIHSYFADTADKPEQASGATVGEQVARYFKQDPED